MHLPISVIENKPLTFQEFLIKALEIIFGYFSMISDLKIISVHNLKVILNISFFDVYKCAKVDQIQNLKKLLASDHFTL